jgi:hypothetical protein
MHGLVLATTSDKGLTVDNWLKRHVRTKTEYHFLDAQV